MTKTFFDFSEMMIGCLHEQGFTNTIKQDKLKAILAELFKTTQFFSSNDFEEAAEELDNCHIVQPEYMKTRLRQLLGWKRRDVSELERKEVWQIPINEEARLFG